MDKWALCWQKTTPFFDTWQQAYDHLLAKAIADRDRARRDAASAERHLARVQRLQPPADVDKADDASSSS